LFVSAASPAALRTMVTARAQTVGGPNERIGDWSVR
jgi:hypothetical protein